ncbi:MAG: DUF805 domain-containing protein [Alphaproteobacteria bacterium]|nr:DUF805 domain-containing protein [Alphaproteobacteria bacterium]
MTHYIINLLFRNLFSFKGRASRKEYVIRITLIPIFFIIINLNWEYLDKNDSWFFLMTAWGFLIIIWILMLQYFPLAVRRLHDLNLSGFCVMVSFVPFGLLLMLLLIFKKGTDGVNDYGEPPEY